MRWKLKIHLRYASLKQVVTLAAFLILSLAAVSNLAYLKAGAAESTLQAPLSPDLLPRQYYLTQSTYNGADATGACYPGYHMASLWEILDTTRLRYDTSLGFNQNDSGQGPPSYSGWVRTGYTSASTGLQGSSNCYAWTSSSASHSGNTALLASDWTSGGEDVHVWSTGFSLCSLSMQVWCVADQAGFPLYLPLVMR